MLFKRCCLCKTIYGKTETDMEGFTDRYCDDCFQYFRHESSLMKVHKMILQVVEDYKLENGLINIFGNKATICSF